MSVPPFLLLLAAGSGPVGGEPVVPAAPSSVQDESHGLLPLLEYGGELATRSYLSGDWGKRRSELARDGWRFDLAYTQSLFGVLDGGKDEDWRYGGKLDALFNADLDRMGVMPGALVTLRTESRYGRSINSIAGTLLPVDDALFFPLTDEPDEDIPITVTELRYTQFLSKQFGVFLGKFVVLGGDANEFAGGRGDTQFISHAFTSASVTALINPYSTLGLGVLVMPDPRLTFSSSLYSSADSSTTTGFDDLDEGWVSSTSVRSQYRLGGKPGGMMLTGQYGFDNAFVDFSGQFVGQGGVTLPRTDDTWNVFWNGWQYLSVEESSDKPIDIADGRADRQGYGLFARCAVADADTNPVDFVASGGLAGRGMFAGRDEDTFGLGYGFSHLHEQAFVTGSVLDERTNRFEAYYSFALTPAAELSVHAQYADQLLESFDPATILGLRLRVQF
ncbi:MAG: carbohydrate porin [Planctomycetota bacterium]